ncbi:hypothetical protein [Vagococcus fluvialis]|uniref:hypothetical protein n=1 Tax=Vagococcus fluvialis TaxID=2738 RepID=UPI001D0A142D|nr:hypothetical protein [Vagococcus fluvialis]UDM80202.1 hypothetical protein K5K97_02395 [Vagococcus fluvialis]
MEKMKVRDSCIENLSQLFEQIVCKPLYVNGISLQFDRIGEDDKTILSNTSI